MLVNNNYKIPQNLPLPASEPPTPGTNASTSSIPKVDITRLEEIKTLCDQSGVGIVPEHLIKLQVLAQESNCLIGIRPVDIMATDLIRNGYPTKGFHIKGKSANWGPQTAFICVKQELSKLVDKPDKIALFNQQIQACIDEGYAQKVPLKITASRLDLLMKKNIVDIQIDAKGLPIALDARTPNGKPYKFELIPVKEQADLYLVQHHGETIEVLAPPGENNKPLTADYDLLMIAPHLRDYGPKDNFMLKEVSHDVFKRNMDVYKNRRHSEVVNKYFQAEYLDPAKFYEREDSNIGNASPRIRAMIPLINKTMVGDGEPVVHHSTDAGSPASDIEANFPATFVLPKPLGRLNDICVIKDIDEFKELIIEAKKEKYYIPVNPLWPNEVTQIRSENFSSIIRRFSS
ncbi:anthrax toxin-like adenylyl cyclase domain-containing protein [Yersinia nurmii]|uniref:Anthrax toxin-like adenylyl cyclase domain-containing protein n=1 Tax=Yersinia nurmii TaxID=685706 RepID=A0AAW7K220_9GAMM|nr:anthrax toxin-like adenylyl cyclase domain-containing protein [Yersinia nurmii]MDN0089363.1 anthrax toxin-like adenylyl cyclase domain-containing protein [Yersinia nurmii]